MLVTRLCRCRSRGCSMLRWVMRRQGFQAQRVQGLVRMQARPECGTAGRRVAPAAADPAAGGPAASPAAVHPPRTLLARSTSALAPAVRRSLRLVDVSLGVGAVEALAKRTGVERAPLRPFGADRSAKRASMFSMMGRSSAKGLEHLRRLQRRPRWRRPGLPPRRRPPSSPRRSHHPLGSLLAPVQARRPPARARAQHVGRSPMVQSDQRGLDHHAAPVAVGPAFLCVRWQRNNVRHPTRQGAHRPRSRRRGADLRLLRHPVVMHPDVTTFDALNVFQAGHRTWRSSLPRRS